MCVFVGEGGGARVRVIEVSVCLFSLQEGA